MSEKFKLFDLKVEVIETGRPFVCSHKVGDYFLAEGENLIFPENNNFSMYALSAILPLLPTKQRPLQQNDWMLSDSVIACPDPNCGAAFMISRVAERILSHSETTVEPIASKGDDFHV